MRCISILLITLVVEAAPIVAQTASPDSQAEQQAEQAISQFRASVEMFASQAQQCQAEQVDAETQFRTEQAKMNELQDQLDQLDQVLAGQKK